MDQLQNLKAFHVISCVKYVILGRFGDGGAGGSADFFSLFIRAEVIEGWEFSEFWRIMVGVANSWYLLTAVISEKFNIGNNGTQRQRTEKHHYYTYLLGTYLRETTSPKEASAS